MQIKIEIDVKPEELRRFLGLPDVAGLQEDILQFLREKVGAASESFDPASFVKDNLDSLRKSSAWRKIMSAAKVGGGDSDDVKPEPVRRSTLSRVSKKGVPGVGDAVKRTTRKTRQK